MTEKLTHEGFELACPKCTGKQFATSDDGNTVICAGCGAEMAMKALQDDNELQMRGELARKMKDQLGL